MAKKLLIMGANPETVSLVQKAKEMGIYTIVTDYDPHAFAKPFADQAENIDCMDVDGLVALAEREKINGVVVGVAEALLKPYCEVCRRLGMPAFATPEQFATLIDKKSFKEACRSYGVPTIEEYSEDGLDNVRFPVIVKPTDACSSKGITICSDRVSLDIALKKAREASRTQHALIETYMTGDEVISYYVIQDGEPSFVGMCDRYTYRQEEQTVQLPTAYFFPSKHIDDYLRTADTAVKKMLRGLGLQNGSIFFQCFVDNDGTVRTYECGYRLNGAQEHFIIAATSGVDAKELYINFALTGKESEKRLADMANPKPNQIGCKLSPLVREGRIAKLRGLDGIREIPGVISVNPSYHEGDTVTGYGTLKQIVCRFFIVTKTKEEMAKTINRILSLLHVEDEQGNSMLIGDYPMDF